MATTGKACRVYMAPMAGITDQAFRTIVHECGAGHLISEMVAVNAIQYKNPKSYAIADVSKEPYPVTVQLVGYEPQMFSDAAKLVTDLGAAAIDINMGCPVKKIVNNNSGSALMKDLPRASAIIEATVKASPLKVSVKFRKGWDNNHINAVEFALMCEQSGASQIAVHGRTRAQGYSGEADWQIIKEVKQAVKIPVIGNGDIDTPQKAQKRLSESGVDGIMIGRGLLGNPWLLNNVHQYLQNDLTPFQPSATDIKQMLQHHIELLVQYYGEKSGIAISRKHISWYVKGLYEAKSFREQYTHLNTLSEVNDLIETYFARIEQ